MRILLKNAKILKMTDDRIIEGHVVVNNNLIEKVGNYVDLNDKYDQVIDCKGNLLMPGFKNAHTHSAMTFLRSVADDSSLQDWLFKEIFPREANLHKDCIRELAKVAILEYLTSGVTSCLDMYFFIDEFKETCEKMGFRALNIVMFNKDNCPKEEMVKFYNSTNNKDELVKYVIGMHAEYTSTPLSLEETKKVLDETKSPFYTHLCETLKETNDCINNRGITPLQFFDSLGMLDNGGAIFHGVYLTDEDISLLKEKNISVVSCPCSNMKLASGVAELRKLLSRGVNVALGTDGPASNNGLDMFREMYLATGLQKIISKNPVSIPAFEVLKMATVNGAIAMNMDNAKYLEEGQLADIIMIDLSRPSMQPINNIINNIVYSGSKDCVKMTMVNGKILYYNGEFLIDEKVEDIYRKVQELTEELKVIKA